MISIWISVSSRTLLIKSWPFGASLTALVAAVTICFIPLLVQYSLNRLRVTNALWIDSSVRLPSSSLSPRRVVYLSVNFIENDFNSRLISAT